MINVAVEGESDREAAKAVVRASHHVVGQVRVAGGKTRLDPLIPKYKQASLRSPWVVFRDSDSACPVELRAELDQTRFLAPNFRLRIAHSMTEAWLLADRERFAVYFDVPVSRLPDRPEDLAHAKRSLLALRGNSRSRSIREEVVARDGNAGPLYVARLNEFAASEWRPRVAAELSDSLRRAISRIAEIG